MLDESFPAKKKRRYQRTGAPPIRDSLQSTSSAPPRPTYPSEKPRIVAELVDAQVEREMVERESSSSSDSGSYGEVAEVDRLEYPVGGGMSLADLDEHE